MIKTLQQFQGGDTPFQLMQSAWSGILNSFLRTPILNGIAVDDVTLAIGDNVINHRLGRKPQGWIITDINAAATVYRSQPLNSLTLTLNSSAVATAQLYVF